MTDQRNPNRGVGRRTLLTGALLAVAATGCALLPGGGDDSASGERPISDLLTDVPDSPGNRQQLRITDHARLARAAGLDWPLAEGPDALDSFSTAVLGSGEVLVPDTFVTQAKSGDDWRTELGFTAADVGITAEAGVPPSVLTVFHTTADPEAIADAVASDEVWSADLQTTEQDGATVYSWGDDPQAVDPSRTSSVRRLGQGGELAVAGDGLVLWATDPAAIDAALAVRDGGDDTGTLADDADFAGLAGALDDEGCHFAFLSDQVPVLDARTLLGPTASPAAMKQLEETLRDAPALPPYRAIGIGNTVDGEGQGLVVFAFATASEQEALAVADAFTAVVAEGTSAATNRPWSELMTVRETTTDGPVAVVTVDAERLSVGLDAYQRLDTLLAARPAD